MPGSASKAASHWSKAALDCFPLVETRYLPSVMAVLATQGRVPAAPACRRGPMLLIELSHYRGRGGLYGGCIHLHSTHISGADSLHIARHDYFLRVPFLKVYPDKAILSRQQRERGLDKGKSAGNDSQVKSGQTYSVFVFAGGILAVSATVSEKLANHFCPVLFSHHWLVWLLADIDSSLGEPRYKKR